MTDLRADLSLAIARFFGRPPEKIDLQLADAVLACIRDRADRRLMLNDQLAELSKGITSPKG